ncbi:MAG: prepilin peptidase [Clostridia bacterium]|nr:prepilin peptidase [Clostridia bacterium]
MEYYLIVFCVGLAIGSFLNVCIYRMPKEESVIMTPSRCTSCGTSLKPLDLVPVISYVFLKGKCRYCGEGVSAKYPLIELLNAAVYIFLLYRFGLSVEFAAASYLASILIAVFFIDLKHYIIPDQLVIAGLAGGILLMVYNLFYPVGFYGGDRSWWNPLAGILSGSGFLFLVAVIGMLIYKTDEAMGMGDVKILAPIGMFLGWKLTVVALLLSVLLGGIISIILIAVNIKKRRDAIPFGPFIVLGTLISMVWGHDIINWYISRLMA